MKKVIGGFFEREDFGEEPNEYHTGDCLKLVNGRSALFVLLDHLKPKRVRLPFYSCDTLLQPVFQLKIPFEYYPLTQNFLPITEDFAEDDFIVFINYFGFLEEQLLAIVSEKNIQHFVLDHTQAFFLKPDKYWAFNSARKFFGVTDGAFLFLKNKQIDVPLSSISFNDDFLGLRKDGMLEKGYELYKENEFKQPCGRYEISVRSDQVLNRLDYKEIAKKRKENFNFLHNRLSGFNALNISPQVEEVPFAYPFLPKVTIKKEVLYEAGIFFPTLWHEVINRNMNGFEWEQKLSSYLIPLPIDHRYSVDDMEYIVNHLLNQLK